MRDPKERHIRARGSRRRRLRRTIRSSEKGSRRGAEALDLKMMVAKGAGELAACPRPSKLHLFPCRPLSTSRRSAAFVVALLYFSTGSISPNNCHGRRIYSALLIYSDSLPYSSFLPLFVRTLTRHLIFLPRFSLPIVTCF